MAACKSSNCPARSTSRTRLEAKSSLTPLPTSRALGRVRFPAGEETGSFSATSACSSWRPSLAMLPMV